MITVRLSENLAASLNRLLLLYADHIRRKRRATVVHAAIVFALGPIISVGNDCLRLFLNLYCLLMDKDNVAPHHGGNH